MPSYTASTQLATELMLLNTDFLKSFSTSMKDGQNLTYCFQQLTKSLIIESEALSPPDSSSSPEAVRRVSVDISSVATAVKDTETTSSRLLQDFQKDLQSIMERQANPRK
jgi:hypothetical protein